MGGNEYVGLGLGAVSGLLIPPLAVLIQLAPGKRLGPLLCDAEDAEGTFVRFEHLNFGRGFRKLEASRSVWDSL